MAFSVERKITLWFIIALGITLYFMYLTFQSKIDYYKRGKWVKLSYDVQAEIQNINGYMQQMEISSHHYFVTGRKESLVNYHNALDSMDNSILRFSRLTADNPKQKELIAILTKLNLEKTGREGNWIRTRSRRQLLNNIESAFVNDGQSLIDSLRTVINMMDYEEDKLLDTRIMAQEAASRNATASLTTLVILFLLTVGIFYYLIINDVKKRRAAELKLAEDEAFLKTIFDKTPDALLLANFETDLIESCNIAAARMFGYDKSEDMIGVCGPSMRKTVFTREQKAELDEAIKTKEIWEKDLEYRRKDGSEFWGCATITVLKFNGRLHKYLHITDITERKNSEDKLRKSKAALKELNKSKDKFFSILAHDLKSPLSGLLGVTEYLYESPELLSKNELKDAAGAIHFTAQKIFGLLNNLLDWARLQTGKMEYCPNKVNLNEIAKEVIGLHFPNAARKSVSMKNKLSYDLNVYADINMVSTILRNLVSNAIKFTDANGEVVISANINGDYAEIKVCDSGVGMSEDMISKVFRIDSVFSSRGTAGEEGSGLGLVLCRELVEKNKGSLSVISEKNKGTEFTFTLPLAQGVLHEYGYAANN